MSDERLPEPAGLSALSPEARRLVLAAQLSAAAARLRDLLAAAAGNDRDAVVRLATSLGSDVAGLDLEEVRAAAAALAATAAGDAPLGSATLALTRSYESALARFHAREGGGPSS